MFGTNCAIYVDGILTHYFEVVRSVRCAFHHLILVYLGGVGRLVAPWAFFGLYLFHEN